MIKFYHRLASEFFAAGTVNQFFHCSVSRPPLFHYRESSLIDGNFDAINSPRESSPLSIHRKKFHHHHFTAGKYSINSLQESSWPSSDYWKNPPPSTGKFSAIGSLQESSPVSDYRSIVYYINTPWKVLRHQYNARKLTKANSLKETLPPSSGCRKIHRHPLTAGKFIAISSPQQSLPASDYRRKVYHHQLTARMFSAINSTQESLPPSVHLREVHCHQSMCGEFKASKVPRDESLP